MCYTVDLSNISFLLSILWFGCPGLSNVLGIYQFIGFFFCYLNLLIIGVLLNYTSCMYAKMLFKYLFWLDNAGTCIESICYIVGSIISNPFVTIPYGQMLLVELVFKISQSILIKKKKKFPINALHSSSEWLTWLALKDHLKNVKHWLGNFKN